MLIVRRVEVCYIQIFQLFGNLHRIFLINMQLRFIITEDGLYQFYLAENS